jgi:hypothetical protein
MKLWSLGFDEDQKKNFPQVLYKGKEINLTIETRLVKEIFKIFYLTHRDEHKKIKEIEKNVKHTLPYKELYHMVKPPKKAEFYTEYLVDLLNIFSVEIDDYNQLDQ